MATLTSSEIVYSYIDFDGKLVNVMKIIKNGVATIKQKLAPKKVKTEIEIKAGEATLVFPVKNEGDTKTFRKAINALQWCIDKAEHWVTESSDEYQFNGRLPYGMRMDLQEMAEVYRNKNGNGSLFIEDEQKTWIVNWLFPGNFVSQANNVRVICRVLTNNK